jgi:pimeloyl-ACP methyl ester carboxylesterase
VRAGGPWLLLALLLLAGCAAPVRVPPATEAVPGTLVRAESLRPLPALLVRAALRFADVPGPTPIRCSARTWALEYWTRDAQGRPLRASGLYAEPSCARPRAVVSYQHGSVSRRQDVPSTLNTEGLAAAAVFAGGGYLLVAPDYPGLGRSPGVHPYLQTGPTARAGRDLLTAARTFAALRGTPWPDALLLAGFSQGGHATVALQRSLEETPLAGTRLLGVAAGSAPFDLARVSFPFALAGHSRDHAAYLAWLVHGLAVAEDRPLGETLREPWASRVPGLLDGAFDEDDLPRDPRELFTEAFLAAHDAGEETWLHAALAANSTHGFAPRAPLRVFYGSEDDTVPPEDALRAVAGMQSAGGDAERIEVGAYDHKDAALNAVPLIRTWFDALTEAP